MQLRKSAKSRKINNNLLYHLEGVSKGRHSALDAESHEKTILIIRGLRVKPARTKRIF